MLQHSSIAFRGVEVTRLEEPSPQLVERRAPWEDGEPLLGRATAARDEGAGERDLGRGQALPPERRRAGHVHVRDDRAEQGWSIGLPEVMLEAAARGEPGRVDELPDGVDQRRLPRPVRSRDENDVRVEGHADRPPEIPVVELQLEEAEHQVR